MTNIQNLFVTTLLIPVCLLSGCMTNNAITVVTSDDAPKAIGPYSQAIRTGDLVFCSGQIGLSPETGQLVGEDISKQTEQALKNLQAILEAAGSDLSHVVKVTIFMTDMGNYATINEVYSQFFTDVKPARSAVEVTKLPKGALVEIECIATLK
jgi:2-iminobutanoate/2-iminopropanoate deaminase